MLRPAVFLTVILSLSATAWAHHGFGTFDMSKSVTYTGKLTRVEFVNPHSWLYFEVTDANGKVSYADRPGPGCTARAGTAAPAPAPAAASKSLDGATKAPREVLDAASAQPATSNTIPTSLTGPSPPTTYRNRASVRLMCWH